MGMKRVAHLFRAFSLTVAAWLGSSLANAQSHPPLSPIRPPIEEVSPIQASQRARTAAARSEAPPEDLIIEHSQPSVLHDASSISHHPPLVLLREARGRSSATTLASRMNLQRTRIEQEQNSALSRIRALGLLSSSRGAARVSTTKNVLNATIIRGAAPGTFERLRLEGFKVSRGVDVRASLSTSVPQINASRVWTEVVDASGRPVTGTGVRIGIIDTGVDYTHPDLGGCSTADFLGGVCAKVAGGYDWVDNDSDPMDEQFHGTHVASIAAGNGTLKGVAPDAVVFGLRVLDAGGSGSSADVIQAIEWSMDPNGDGDLSDHLDVINLSLGASSGTPDSPDALAADAASEAGVVVVVAAGNDGPGEGTIGTPGTSRKAITVGAVDSADTIAGFSSRGPVTDGEMTLIKPDLVAPGVSICAAKLSGFVANTCVDGEHFSLSGTSMATPHVAGVAALMKQTQPSLPSDTIKAILKDTAIKLLDQDGALLASTIQGAGRVNALAAVQSALTGETPPSAAITTSGEVFLDETTINGTASGTGFESYELSYRPLSDPNEVVIQTSTTPVITGALGVLNVGELPSGRYVLRLVVRTATRTVEDSATITVRHATITEPVAPIEASATQRMVHGQSRFISVTGRANGRDLVSYSLTVCWKFADTEGCSNDPITLSTDGVTPVNSGTLGTIDIAALPLARRGLYDVRLTARYSSRADETVTRSFYLDPNILRDYHAAVTCGSTPCADIGSQPTLADINGDGRPETIYTLARDIHVVDHTGASLPGWPRTVDETLFTPPSVGDIDGDGSPEVIAQGYAILSSTRVRSAVFAFHADGTSVDGWPYRYDGTPAALQRYVGDFVTVADINGDGAAEVLLSPIEVLGGNGSPLSTWPTSLPGLSAERLKMYGGFAVNDIDNDGAMEVIWSATNWYDWIYQGTESSKIVIQSSDGSVLTAVDIQGLMPTGPVVADLDGDGTREVATFVRDNINDRSSIFAHSKNGTLLSGWPFHINNFIFGDIVFSASLIAADINSDGRAELITHSDIDTRVLSSNGGVVTARRPQDSTLSGFGAIVAGNVDGDPEPEIIFVSRYYPMEYPVLEPELDPRTGLLALVALNSDLSLVPGFPILAPETSAGLYSLALGDVDGVAGNEILYPANSGEIIAFQTGGCSNTREAWPFERGIAARLGAPSTAPMCQGSTPIFESCARHSDHDLIDDCQDLCPTTDRLLPDPVCGCALGSNDSDNDGTPNCLDACSLDSAKTTPGTCGCGISDTDSDSDGTPDCFDSCPDDPEKISFGTCGCGVSDRDANNNGFIDCGEEDVEVLARPTEKPRLLRKRGKRFTFAIPTAQSASLAPSSVQACVRSRGRTRCRAPRQGKATFDLQAGTSEIFYLWTYRANQQFKSPRLRVRIGRR